MSWIKITRILDRDQAIDGLARIRQEWQEAANGKPLADMRGNVGLILADVVNTLGLTPDEAARVFGGEMFIDTAQMKLLEPVR